MLLEAQMWAMQMAVVWLDGLLSSECPPFLFDAIIGSGGPAQRAVARKNFQFNDALYCGQKQNFRLDL